MRYWLLSGQILNAVPSDLSLTPESLRVWRRQMEQTPTPHEAEPDPSASNLALACEISQLKRELEAMTRQPDILDNNRFALLFFKHDNSLYHSYIIGMIANHRNAKKVKNGAVAASSESQAKVELNRNAPFGPGRQQRHEQHSGKCQRAQP